jgi:hypothetical protein
LRSQLQMNLPLRQVLARSLVRPIKVRRDLCQDIE